MLQQIAINGDQLILGHNGALVASRSQPGYWHCVREINGALTCDCDAWTKGNRRNCRHVLAVAALSKRSGIKVHQDEHDRADHATHDPNCRYCRQMCLVCQREWERTPVDAPKVERTSDTAPLAGPAIDPPLMTPSRKWTKPAPKSFDELFPGYTA